MVALISDIVEEIVLIAGLSLFMELMLPSGNLKKYSQFVMGLLVIIAIINPLVNFFGGNLSQVQVASWQVQNFDTYDDDTYDDDTAVIVSAGQNLAMDLEVANAAAAEETLERQIRSMAKMVDGVEDVAVDLILAQQELVDLQVLLTLAENSDADLPADEISAIKSDVLDIITSFFDVDPNKVQISVVEVDNS